MTQTNLVANLNANLNHGTSHYKCNALPLHDKDLTFLYQVDTPPCGDGYLWWESHSQPWTGFHPVCYSILRDYAKNYLVSVYFLTQTMMKSDTSVPKKLIFSPIKGCLPLTPPPCWAHVNPCFNQMKVHMYLAFWGVHYSPTSVGGKVCLTLRGLLYNQQRKSQQNWHNIQQCCVLCVLWQHTTNNKLGCCHPPIKRLDALNG